MKRTPSSLAQISFSIVNKLHHFSKHAQFPVRQFARTVNRIANPLTKHIGKDHVVSACLYGHNLLMPAEHPLAPTLAMHPQYNRPLALTAQAIAESSQPESPLVVIDVGANIGETIAIIEQRCPGIGHYLCIEADQEIAELCRVNHTNNARVQVEQCFIGDREGLAVWLQDDGRANPSTKLITETDSPQYSDRDRLVRLDTVAKSFTESHGALSLLKVDTEGFDFSVLRSASTTLRRYRPAIFFEWYPKLLTQLGEEVGSGFEYLGELGYEHFIFFTNQGDYYCAATEPENLFIRSLAARTLCGGELEYFDVVATSDQSISRRLMELSALEMNN